jgi:response regulator NasT
LLFELHRGDILFDRDPAWRAVQNGIGDRAADRTGSGRERCADNSLISGMADLASSLRSEAGVKRPGRWRIVVLDDHERSRAALRAAIWAAGGEVVGEATRCADVLEIVRASGADVGIFAVGLSDGDGVDVAAKVIADGCPVILLTSHTGDELVERARAAGVMAFLVKPLRAAELLPTVDLAIARFREARALRQRLDERKLLERAKGILMAHSGSARMRPTGACAVRPWTAGSPWPRLPARCSPRSRC